MSLLAASRLGLRRLAPSTSTLFQTVRGFSAAPAQGKPDQGADLEDDIVLETFREQQAAYRKLAEAGKKIPIPLDGKPDNVKKYAQQFESLKRQAGMPELDQLIDANLEYQLEVSNYNVRKFLVTATENKELGEYEGLMGQLYKALDDIENETGAPVDASNEEGWQKLGAKVADLQKQFGLDDLNKVKDQAIYDMYKKQIDDLRQKAVSEMEAVKRRDGLDWVEVDPAQLKPSAS